MFYGAVTDDARNAALAQASIACFPSLFGESFGIVVAEAVAAGAGMVLAGDNAGYRELLADPACLVDARDTTAFAHRLDELLADPAARARIATRQRAVLDRCDPDVITDAIVALYDRAIGARRAAPSAASGRANDRVLA